VIAIAFQIAEMTRSPSTSEDHQVSLNRPEQSISPECSNMSSSSCIERLASSDPIESAEISIELAASQTRFQQTDPTLSLDQTIQHFEQSLIQIVSESSSPQSALLRLTTALGELFQADSCMVLLQGNPRSPLSATYWLKHHSAHFSTQLGLPGYPDLLPLLLAADLLAIPDLLATQEMSASLPANRAPSTAPLPNTVGITVRAVLGVKTQFQSCRNGGVVLMRSHQHFWTEVEIQQLQVAANVVSIAIAQVQLQEQLQRQTQYQGLIGQLTEAIRTSGQLDQVFQLALEGTVSALQVSRGMVLLIKYRKPLLKRLTLEQISSAKVSIVQEYQIELPETSQNQGFNLVTPAALLDQIESPQTFCVSQCQLCHEVLVTAEPLLITDIGGIQTSVARLDTAIRAELGESIAIAPIFQTLPALLLVPLIHQETVLGYLALQHALPCPWQPEELAFVQLVATQLSTAIIQSRTFQQIHGLVEKRTVQLQHSLEVQAKLYEKSREQVEQLRYLNQLKDEFLSTISHELLTPLTSMTLAIRMLQEANLSPERRAKYLGILEQQCVHETSLINDLLALQKLESRSTKLPIQKIDIKHLIQNLVPSFEERWVKKGVTLKLDLSDRPLTIHSNPDDLNRILTELLTNAGKYAEPGSTICLQANPEVDLYPDGVVLTLHNIGAAISPEEMPHIFDRFYRGKGVTQQAIPGTGLGLALVKGLVAQLNGAIVVSSYPIQGEIWETCFTLTLPQFPNLVDNTEI
jgi:signal transduction histidine kinase